MSSDQRAELTAYVPRVLLEWPDGIHHRTLEGTLVHIDISGFTAMSERLAAKGKVGAEEVAGVLSSVFTELLTVAGELGADMLKFGGDALLLLFTGAQHELRAVRASGEMRTRLRQVGKVNTPAGRVSLRMTVGVHSGQFDFFVVGTLHRELIVTGANASKVVEMEETAEAGEIMLSASTAAAVPGEYLGEPRGDGLLLARMPPPMSYEASPLVPCADPSVYVPTALRSAAGTGAGDGEHRVITAAFVKFHGTDEVISRDGGDALCDELDALVTVAQEAADEFGVAFLATDVDRNGGKIILTAGSPTASGADEERMLRTVRAIVDRFSAIPIKVGVNRGAAFSGDVGAPFRRAFTVIGDAVNLAARVMSRAVDEQILSTAGPLDLSEAIFAVEAVEPFHVKGKTEAVEAWSVGGIAGRRSAGTDEIPIVGRVDELETALAAIAGDTATGMIDIFGPSGIGKSRLVRELRSRAPDTAWHFSSAELFEASTPYFPYQRLLREALGIELNTPDGEVASALEQFVSKSAPELGPWLPLAATVMDLSVPETDETAQLDPKYRGVKTHETVETLLNAALEQPTVLIIEDAHWIDEASYELTKYLGEHGVHRRWMILTVHRPAEHGFGVEHGVSIELGPLDDTASTELAQVLLADSPMLASRLKPIVARSGGNPLFLTELVNAAAAGGKTEELPDSVEALVLARIDGLDPLHRKLLRYASVVGTSFATDLLVSAMFDIEPAVADADSWRALGEFVVERSKGDMRFRQQLFHDVAYTGLPYRSRRVLHERVGRALEDASGDAADSVAERLSLHFLRAEVYDKAWHYSVVAGDAARAKFGNLDAIEFYRRALRAGDNLGIEDDELASVAETLGDVADMAGMYDEADHAYGEARHHAEVGSRRSTRLMRKQGGLREKRGAYPQALRWFSRALGETADSSPESEAVELRLSYAGVRYRQGKYRDTFKWASEALEDAKKRDDRTAAAHAHRLLGLVLNLRGEVESLDHLRAALEIYEDNDDLPGQADALTNLGRVDYRLGKWELAVERWQQCMERRRRLGDDVSAAMAENNVASVCSDQGHWNEAVEMFRRVRRVLRAAGHNLGVAVVTSNLGRAAARAGRFDEAHGHLDQAIAQLEPIGAEQMVLEAKAHLAEAYLFAGDAVECEAVTRAILGSIGSRTGMGELPSLMHRVLGYAQLLKGDVDAAVASFASSLELAVGDYETALTLEAIAQLPSSTDAERNEAIQRAAEIFEKLGVVRTPDVPLPALVG